MNETAYIYPTPYWKQRETGWIKSLLLFFDDIAILLPDHMRGHHFAADPVLAEPLEERSLLHVLDPNSWLDQEAIECFANTICEMLATGVFDGLAETDHFAQLSLSRMGYGSNVKLASFLVDELQQRGLAKPSEDGVSMPLHPTLRTAVLVILGQISRSIGERRGQSIHPTTNQGSAVKDLIQTLSMDAMPSRQHVVQLDIEPVAFDLSLIPLDDVLQFRAEHQDAYRAYARDLRRFMIEIGEVDESADREARLLERRQEIADQAHELQRINRRELKKNLATCSLGIAGGAWSLSAGDLTGLGFVASGLVAGLLPSRRDTVGAYTYVFKVGKRLRTEWSR